MQLSPPARAAEALRERWAWLWALVLLPPAVLTLLSMSWAEAAAAVVVALGLAATTAIAMTAGRVAGAGQLRDTAVRFGVCATVTCLGFTGLFIHADRSVWAVAAAYVTTAVWAHSTRNAPGQVFASARLVGPVATSGFPAVQDLREMTAAELCRAWRRSFAALTSAPDAAAVAGLVSHRQHLLDELELRDPAGLQAWLSSGARAAGGPERFLGRDDPAGPRNAA